MIPKLKTIERLSFCCKAEMYQSGACTNCGADGLNKPMTKEKYEWLMRGNDLAEAALCDLIIEILNEREQFLAKASNEARENGNEAVAMEAYWLAMAIGNRAIPYVEDWKNSL